MVLPVRHVFLLAGLLASAKRTNSCDMNQGSQCTCDSAQYNVICTGLDQEIDDVLPLIIPKDTKNLSLRKNWVIENVSLRPSHLDGLDKLVNFDISKNRVNNIETGTFQNFADLRVVDLSRNRLRVLESDAFGKNLPNIVKLNLASNRLVVLMNYNFQSLRLLRELDLRKNPLLYVSPSAFVGLGELQVLRLSGCNLTRLPTEALKSLVKLDVLELRQFRFVTNIEPGAFKLNQRITSLIIDQFSSMTSFGVSPSAFEGLSLSLQTLRMTSCNLTEIPELAIRNLYNLRSLDFSNNRIEVLGRSSFANLRKLIEMDLSNNALMKIMNLALRGNPNLTSLDLSNNRLKTLSRNSFPSSLSSFVNLSLVGNNWSCDCRLQWVVSKLGKALGKRAGFCSTPFIAQGFALKKFANWRVDNCSLPNIDTFIENNVTEVMVGDEIELPCVATGSPNPTITWYTPIGSFVKPLTTRVRHELPSNTLRIRFARIDDAGEYHCVAVNRNGDHVRTVTLLVKGGSSYMSNITPVPDTSGPRDGCEGIQQVSPLLRIVLIGVLACVSCVGLLSSFFLAVWGYNNKREVGRLRTKIETYRKEAIATDELLVENKRSRFAEKKVTFGQSLSSGYGSVINSPNSHKRQTDAQRTPNRLSR